MDISNISTKSPKIEDLGAKRGDLALEEVLEKIASIPSLAYPPVLFPDLNFKIKNESPSSLATATKGTIVPNLTSPSLGCSMGVIATNLEKKDTTPEFQKKFYKAMQDHLGESYGIFENILVWFGLKKRPILKYDLTLREFDDIIRRGAAAAADRFNLPGEILNNLEFRGSLFSEEEQRALNIKKILPRSSFTNGRHDLGYGFKGNHFLEIQVVEEIFDEEFAEKFGLKKGNVVIMYHGGGGLIPYHVGRYFANRDKKLMGAGFLASRIKLVLHFFGKIFFHLLSADGIRNFKTRYKYYFRPDAYQEIPIDSEEGRRLFQATKASLNYSYAFNIAIYRRVKDALEKINPKIKARLVTAKIHNSIHQEKGLVVHRHTVTRISPKETSLISGFNNTASFLILGQDGSDKYLNSTDHGSGAVIKKFKENNASSVKDGKTIIHRTKEPFREEVSHITDEGIEYVIERLEEKNIARRAVKLRPIASFKG